MPNEDGVWIKVKPPAYVGPVTLLEDGEFLVKKKARLNISAVEKYEYEGVKLAVSNNKLFIDTADDSWLVKYENEAWHQWKKKNESSKSQAKPKRAPQREEIEVSSDGWPLLETFPDSRAKPSLCTERAETQPFTVELDPDLTPSLGAYAEDIVRKLKGLRIPNTFIGWSDRGNSDEFFRLLLAERDSGDTMILTEIECLLRGTLSHVRVVTQLVVWPVPPLRRVWLFLVRLFTTVFPLTCLMVVFCLMQPKLFEASGRNVLVPPAVGFLVTGLVLLRIISQETRRDYQDSVRWPSELRRKLFWRTLAWPGGALLLSSAILMADSQMVEVYAHSLISPETSALGMFSLVLLVFFGRCLKHLFWGVDFPKWMGRAWATPSPSRISGTHQAVTSIVMM